MEVFGKKNYDSLCKDLSKNVNDSYDLSNHLKVPQTIKFHAKFSVLSALKSPIKLKLWNCSHLHYSEKIIHRGSMIEVIIPEDCFIMFSCGLVYCGTPSWFINRGEYGKNTRAFFTIVEKISF